MSVIALDDLGSGLHQLCGDRFHMRRDDVLDHHVTARRSRRDHIGSRLDLIRDDRIGTSVQFLSALDTDNIRSGALDGGSHHVQEVCDIDNMRLLRHVLKNSLSFCAGGRKHHVDCCADRDYVEENLGASQLCCLCPDHVPALIHVDLGTESAHTLDVLVDRTSADHASARKGQFDLAVSCEHRSEQIIRGTHGTDLRESHIEIIDAFGVDPHASACRHIHFRSQSGHDMTEAVDIRDIRQILQYAWFPGKNRRRNNGDSGVLRSADRNRSFQAPSAANAVKLAHSDCFLKSFGFAENTHDKFNGFSGIRQPKPLSSVLWRFPIPVKSRLLSIP